MMSLVENPKNIGRITIYQCHSCGVSPKCTRHQEGRNEVLLNAMGIVYVHIIHGRWPASKRMHTYAGKHTDARIQGRVSRELLGSLDASVFRIEAVQPENTYQKRSSP